MKKKIWILLLMGLCICCVYGCGKKENAAKTETKTAAKIETKTETKTETKIEAKTEAKQEDIVELRKPVEEMISGFTQDFETLEDSIGNTYEGYKEHKKDVEELYKRIDTESEEVLNQFTKNSEIYLCATIEEQYSDSDVLSDRIDEYYDVLYSDVMDEYYDEVYSGVLSKMYDLIYGGILSDAYDTLEYEEWFDANDEAYEEWFESKDKVYDMWFDSKDKLYDMWMAATDAIYYDEIDAEDVKKNIQEAFEKSAAEKDQVEETSTQDENVTEKETDESLNVSADVTPEFKTAMDSYEAFINEYVEFMKKYSQADDITGMINEYSEYMKKYVDTTKKIGELKNSEMTTADAQYYLEVTARINTKLLELTE